MIKILFENKVIIVDKINQRELKVNDVIRNLKRFLNKSDESINYILINEERKMNHDEIINLNSSGVDKVLQLVELKNYNKINQEIKVDKKSSLQSIEILIMKATNAKEMPKTFKKNNSKNRYYYQTGENFEDEILQHLLQRNTNSTERFESIRNILRTARTENSENEEQTSQSRLNSRNAYNISSRPNMIQPDPAMVENLKEMGFEEERIMRVLIATNNELTSATEMLLNDTDLALNDDISNSNYYRNFPTYYNIHSNVVNGTNVRINDLNANNMDIDDGDNGEIAEGEICEVRLDDDPEVEDIIEMDQGLIEDIENEVYQDNTNSNINHNPNNQNSNSDL